MLKAIVFDFDGVIVDSEPLHYRAFAEAVGPLGIELTYEHYLEHLIGYDDRDAFRIMLAQRDGTTSNERAGPEAYRGDESRIVELKSAKGAAFERIVRQSIDPVPGAVELIDAAGQELPIAICSGATRHDIEVVFEAIGLSDRFDPIVTADDVAVSKPDPTCYRLAVEGLAARHAELRPSECLAIEDTAAGIEAARGAGLWTLGITTTTDAEHLRRAHRVIDTFVGLTVEQLRTWFA